jgi:ABC-type nitrate/sulfonate/bicarbonate transport system permease component
MALARARWRVIYSPVAVVLVWELLAAVGVLRPNYVPPPSQLGPHLVELLAGGELWRHLGITLYRLGLSFVFALIPAICLVCAWACPGPRGWRSADSYLARNPEVALFRWSC